MNDIIQIEEDIKRINHYICLRIDILKKFNKSTEFMSNEEKINLSKTNPYYYNTDDYLKDLIQLEYMYNGIYNYKMPLRIKDTFFYYRCIYNYI